MAKPSPSPPQYLEVHCRSSGRTMRFAPGTESGFALSLINRNLKGTLRVPTHIEAVKDGEEPIAFGPNSILSHVGEGWKLQTVSFTQLPSEEARNRPVRGMAMQTPGLKRNRQLQRPIFTSDDSQQLFHLGRVHSKDGSSASTSFSSPETTAFSTSVMPRVRGAGWVAGREAEMEANTREVEHATATAQERREAMTASHRRRPVNGRQSGPSRQGRRHRQEPRYEEHPHEGPQHKGYQHKVPHEEPVEMHIDAPAEEGPFPGGPSNTSLLKSFRDHVAYHLWSGEDREGPLRVFAHGKKLQKWFEDRLPLPPAVQEVVDQAGLSNLMYCSYKMIDNSLLTAFAERWHRETSSFHLPFGEMTITLDDVSCILGIPVRGALFVSPQMDIDIGISVLQSLLGVSHAEASAEITGQGCPVVSLSWLQDLYDIRRHEGRMDEAARAFILVLLGMTILTDKSSTRVDCKYLELVRHLGQVGQWSWGALALCTLYGYLGDASRFECHGLAGYMTLFQAWIYEYFHNIVDRTLVDGYDGKRVRANRWRPKKGKGKVLPYRQALDALTIDDVCWTPWATHRQHCPLTEMTFFSGYIRCGNTIVPYLPERVLRQFGYKQDIPREPPRRPSAKDIIFGWMSPHLYSIRYILQLRRTAHPAECVEGYMEWYYRVSHPLLIPPQAPPPHASHPQAPHDAYVDCVPRADYVDAKRRLDRIAAMLHQVVDNALEGDELCDSLQEMLRIAEGH